MFNANTQNKFLNRMFRRIHGLVWDLTTGNIGVQDEGGIHTLIITPGEKETDASTFRTSVNPFDNFGTAIPAFAQQVPHDKIKIGDIVVGDKGILGWVIDKKAVALTLLDKNGMTKNFTPPKVQIMGTEGALVVQSLFSVAGGQDGLTGLQGSLLPLLAFAGEDSLEKILPIMLFSQSTGTGAGAMNPMMLLAMSGGLGKGKGGKEGGIDPMMLMMMSGGMGGGAAGGMNPMLMMAMMGEGGLGNLFGGETKVLPGTGSNGLTPVPALQQKPRY